MLNPDAPITQQSVAGREMTELNQILDDPTTLARIAGDALGAGSLEETSTLTKLSEVTGRLLQRNNARQVARAFVDSISEKKRAGAALDAALDSLWVTSSRAGYNREEWQRGTLSKFYLHGLTAGGSIPATTLCVRFSLAENIGVDDPDESLHDLSLKVLQVHPFVANSAKFALSFTMQDTKVADAGGWSLDEDQRARLLELHALLGKPLPFGTAAAMLGFLLAAGGAKHLEKDPFMSEALRVAREAHREEMLEGY